MTKDEMTTLLRSVGVNENTVTAMENAYELGFEQGANVAEVMKSMVVEAVAMCHEIDAGDTTDTAAFWKLHDSLKGMQ
jgi:hypothetical protein